MIEVSVRHTEATILNGKRFVSSSAMYAFFSLSDFEASIEKMPTASSSLAIHIST